MEQYNDSPYSMCDGYWGGFGGPEFWQTFNWSGKNVFERRFDAQGYWEYFRVWDCGLNAWRDITMEERIKLPMRVQHPTREEIKRSRDDYYIKR